MMLLKGAIKSHPLYYINVNVNEQVSFSRHGTREGAQLAVPAASQRAFPEKTAYMFNNLGLHII